MFKILLIACILSSCTSATDNKAALYRNLSKDDPHNIRYAGHYKIGKPYKIKGKRYRPKRVTRYRKRGIASWYGARYGFHGKRTANGDIYNKELLTAAHPTLPLPSIVRVTNLANKRSVIVLVNDRGPYAFNRIIDLSEKAASIIGITAKGTGKVRISYLNRESQKFLKILGLKAREGSKSKRPLMRKGCSVNCHIQLLNLRYHYTHPDSK